MPEILNEGITEVETRSQRMKRAYAEKKEFVAGLKNGGQLSPLWDENVAKYFDVSMSRLAGQLLKLEKSLLLEAEKSEAEDVNKWTARAEGILAMGIINLTERENFGLKNISEAAEFTLGKKFASPTDLYQKLDQEVRKETGLPKIPSKIEKVKDWIKRNILSKFTKEKTEITISIVLATAYLGIALFQSEGQSGVSRFFPIEKPAASEPIEVEILTNHGMPEIKMPVIASDTYQRAEVKKEQPTLKAKNGGGLEMTFSNKYGFEIGLNNQNLPDLESQLAEKVQKTESFKVVPKDKKNEATDQMQLTGPGEMAYELYELYRDTPGWWNKNGEFTPEDFVTLMLSYELGPLINVNDAVTDDGRKVKDLVAESSTRWLNSQCTFVTGKTCSRPSANALLHWIGANSESLKRRWNSLYLNENRQEITPDPSRLKLVTRQEGRNTELAEYVVKSIQNPPNTEWTVTTGAIGFTRPLYWGNESMFTNLPTDPIYRFGSGATAFYIISQEQANETAGR